VTFQLARGGGTWELVGEWDAAAISLPPRQRAVLALLREGATSNNVLMAKTSQTASALSHMLRALEDKGLVVRVANGWRSCDDSLFSLSQFIQFNQSIQVVQLAQLRVEVVEVLKRERRT